MAKHKVLKVHPARKYIIFSLFLFLFIGIGYSILGTDLDVFGSISVDKYDKTLYGAFEKEYKKGYAREYTGDHHDSFTEEPSQKIYHWYVENSTTSDAIKEKNNVIFANYCWQMLRTTDTGGVKLIYSGTPDNGACTRTGTGQQIGTSKFNTYSYTDNPAIVGYMLNKQYYDNRISSKEKISTYSMKDGYLNWWYADEIVWNDATSTWELVDPYKIDSINDNYRYTFSSSDINYSSSTVKYVIEFEGGYSYYYIELKDGHDLSYYNHTYTYGDSYIDNGDGTYSLENPQSMQLIEYYFNANKLRNKFVCRNAVNNICDEVMYPVILSSDYFVHVTTNHTYKYADSFTYDEATGKYRLSDDNVYVWNIMNSTERNKINTHHYTFFNQADESSEIYYVTETNTETGQIHYFTLTDGKSIEDALNEMFYADDVNTNPSVMKTYIENWYANNLIDYTGSIEDTIFCYDRSQKNAEINGWNPNGGSVTEYLDFSETANGLACVNETDQFSTNNQKAKNLYPVGLPTIPELRLFNYTGLYTTGSKYWTGTPSHFTKLYNTSGAFIDIVDTSTSFMYSNGAPSSTYGVRPVVSIKPGTKYTSGNGSKNNPYILDVTPDSINVTIHGATNETITYSGAESGTITTDGSGNATATLKAGHYTFTSNKAKSTSNASNYYSKEFDVSTSSNTLNFYPDGAIIWYGNGFSSASSLYSVSGGIGCSKTIVSSEYAGAGFNNSNDPCRGNLVFGWNQSSSRVYAASYYTNNTITRGSYTTLHASGWRSGGGDSKIYAPTTITNNYDSSIYASITSSSQQNVGTSITSRTTFRPAILLATSLGGSYVEFNVVAIWME